MKILKRLPTFGTLLWLTVVWVLLWGDITLGTVVAGVILALVVGTFFTLPRVEGIAVVRPIPFLVLAVRFIYDIVMAAFKVAIVAFRRRPPTPAVVRVQLRSHSDLILATTAGMTTLIPGSVAIDTQRLAGIIYIHVFDVSGPKPKKQIEEFREAVLAQERRLLLAFGSVAELADAGCGRTIAERRAMRRKRREEDEQRRRKHRPRIRERVRKSRKKKEVGT